jgi:hypothetical protein
MLPLSIGKASLIQMIYCGKQVLYHLSHHQPLNKKFVSCPLYTHSLIIILWNIFSTPTFWLQLIIWGQVWNFPIVALCQTQKVISSGAFQIFKLRSLNLFLEYSFNLKTDSLVQNNSDTFSLLSSILFHCWFYVLNFEFAKSFSVRNFPYLGFLFNIPSLFLLTP